MATGVHLRLAGAALRGRAQLCEQLAGRLVPAVALAGQERLHPLLPSVPASCGLGYRSRNASEIGLSRCRNRPIGPGQNRSSSACSWLLAPPASARDPRARGSAPAAPWSGRCRARAPGSDGDRCAPARRARTRQTCRTSRPQPGTGASRPRPGWDATPSPATRRPTAARPTARPVARSRPARTLSRTSVRHSAVNPPRRARTSANNFSPVSSRPARRASPTPNQRRHNYFPSVLPSRSGLHSAPTKEVPLRALIDRPSKGYVLLPLVGTSHRREELVSSWPSTGRAALALSRRWSRHPEDDL